MIRRTLIALGACALTPAAHAQHEFTPYESWCGTLTPEFGERGHNGGQAWPGGVVPYEFDPGVTGAQRQALLDRWAEIDALSNVSFVARTNQADHLYVRLGVTPDVSFSSGIGVTGGRQYLEIWPAHFDRPGILLHETLHALGFHHEHQRPDRSAHIALLTANIDPAYISQYLMLTSGTMHEQYDFASVMHYGPFGFAHRGTSFRVYPPFYREWQWRVGQYANANVTASLSIGDRRALVARYGGPTPPPRLFNPATPPDGFAAGNSWAPTFSWTQSDGAHTYLLEVDDDPYFRSPEISVVRFTGQLQYTQPTPLPENRIYYWRVTAGNPTGQTRCAPQVYRMIYTGTTPTVLHVDASAPAGGTGASWADALNNLRIACDFACTTRTVTEIRVAGGVYTADCGTGDRNAVFFLPPACAVMGGYAGHAAQDPNERDHRRFVTRLSADLAKNDGPNFSNNSENAYSVVTGDRHEAAGLLEGFEISGGNANGPTWRSTSGGGLLIHHGFGTVRDCTFTGNYAANAGGAAWVMEGEPRFDRCVFAENLARTAAVLIHSCRATITNSLFVRNHCTTTTGGGGAVAVYEANPYFVSCTFTQNSSPTYGAAVDLSDDSTVNLSNCVLWGNIAPASPEISLNQRAIPGLEPCAVFIRRSVLQGGWQGIATIAGDTVGINANFETDPNFNDPDAGDFTPRAPSPCIDASWNSYLPSDATLDARGMPRFVDHPGVPDSGLPGGAVHADIGAIEFQGPFCDPDINCDGSADQGDVACIVLALAGDASCSCLDPDFNFDGSADQGDLAGLINAVAGEPCE